MKRKLLIIIAIIFVLAGIYAKAKYETRNYQKPHDTQTPESLNLIPNNWKTYSSTKFNYTFSYPPTWSFIPYDETNPSVQFGTHSLSSYDIEKIQQYMDHGIVNWKEFLGDKPAIRIDLMTYAKGSLERELSDYTQLESSKLSFGSLNTTEYHTKNEMTGQDVFIYEAEYDNNLIVANVFFYNIDTISNLQNTQEWAELRVLFNSFRFNE